MKLYLNHVYLFNDVGCGGEKTEEGAKRLTPYSRTWKFHQESLGMERRKRPSNLWAVEKNGNIFNWTQI